MHTEFHKGGLTLLPAADAIRHLPAFFWLVRKELSSRRVDLPPKAYKFAAGKRRKHEEGPVLLSNVSVLLYADKMGAT